MVDTQNKIIVLLALGCIFASITAFSLGCATGFYISKNISVKVIAHD
jgi:hypothetical protein